MMKMNTKKLGTLALLAVFVLVFASAGSAMAATGTDAGGYQVLVKNSLKHYVMALEAYNDGNYGKVEGQLQAAASNAKHADPELADLLEELNEIWGRWDILSTDIATQIANTYNHYIVQNDWNYPQFDPGNPLSLNFEEIKA